MSGWRSTTPSGTPSWSEPCRGVSGEYKRPDGGLNVLSDGRIVLRDPGNARIQVYSPEGEAIDTWRIRGNFNTSRRMVVDQEDRSHALILLDPEASVTDWKTGLVQINPDGTPGDTLEIPDTPWEEPTIEASHEDDEGNTSMSVNSVPFGPTENAVLSPKGYFIHGISTEYAITLLREGRPALRIEKVFTPVAVGSGERREEEAGAVRTPDGLSRYPHPVFTREWVLGIVRDQFDVQTVVMFRVELPSERSAETTRE